MNLDFLKGWRTVTANILMAALPILEVSGLTDYMPDEWMVWYILGMSVANIYLRVITTSPVGKSL